MRKLLCVTAHPDDEAGCFGGVLARYAEEGIACSVLCLTAGERAANRGGNVADEALKAVRRVEFADSCRHLGVADCAVLDYPDGGLYGADFAAAVADVVKAIRRFQPQVVIGFGSEGYVTAHPDHGMAGLITQAAFQFAARETAYIERLAGELPPWRAQRLYSVTTEFSLPERPPIALAPVTARVDVGKWVERKIEAFARHTSQLPLLPIFRHAQEQAGTFELYHLLASDRVSAVREESDLFEAVEEG